jgi:predicted RNA-binding Zn ribbon-like protein
MQQAVAGECRPVVCESSDLLLSLVNTRPAVDGRPELLGDRAALARWLTDSGLGDGETLVTDADAAAARELREAFVTIFRAHVGCTDGANALPEAEAYLQRVAERYPLTPRISAAGCTLVPSQTGVLGAFGSLLAAVADLASRGAWLRLKMCKNDSCYAGFFDKTRNSSGLYCGTACGTQVSQRAYRSRLKNG